MCIVQSPQQRRWYEKYANGSCIYIDSTHKTTQYSLQLYAITIAVPLAPTLTGDRQSRGVPIAYMIAGPESLIRVTIFARSVFLRSPHVSPICVMSDISPSLYQGVARGIPSIVHYRLCLWHFKRAVSRKAVMLIREVNHRDRIMGALNRVIDAADTRTRENEWKTFLDVCIGAEGFGSYMKAEYGNRLDTWTRAGNMQLQETYGSTISAMRRTNMLSESLWRVLKHSYFHGVKNYSIVKCVEALSQHIISLVDTEVNGMLREIAMDKGSRIYGVGESGVQFSGCHSSFTSANISHQAEPTSLSSHQTRHNSRDGTSQPTLTASAHVYTPKKMKSKCHSELRRLRKTFDELLGVARGDASSYRLIAFWKILQAANKEAAAVVGTEFRFNTIASPPLSNISSSSSSDASTPRTNFNSATTARKLHDEFSDYDSVSPGRSIAMNAHESQTTAVSSGHDSDSSFMSISREEEQSHERAVSAGLTLFGSSSRKRMISPARNVVAKRARTNTQKKHVGSNSSTTSCEMHEEQQAHSARPIRAAAAISGQLMSLYRVLKHDISESEQCFSHIILQCKMHTKCIIFLNITLFQPHAYGGLRNGGGISTNEG